MTWLCYCRVKESKWMNGYRFIITSCKIRRKCTDVTFYPTGNRYQYSTFQNSAKTQSPLPARPQVLPADTTYFGTFTCKASNLLGENSLDIELFEATVPSELTDVKFADVTATSVTLEMNGPANTGGLPLISYAVQYKMQGESWDARQEQQWPVGTTYVVTDLQPERQYDFR